MERMMSLFAIYWTVNSNTTTLRTQFRYRLIEAPYEWALCYIPNRLGTEHKNVGETWVIENVVG